VGIIGGGPAGASMAAYLAKAGVKCVVFESELFPRPHVGESLVPSSTRVFKELDFIQTMEAAEFPRKYGAVWTSAASGEAAAHDWEGLGPDTHARIRFDERPQPGVDRNYTYHVDRAKFDLLLLQHAGKLGAAVHEGVNVLGVDFSSPFPEIRYRSKNQELSTNVRMVVDASGRRTLLGSQLGLKVKDTVFDQFALHTWFEGFDRESTRESRGLGDYIFVHFLPLSNTWVWQIPITKTITSIGVVTQKKNLSLGKHTREAFFWDAIRTRPELHESLCRAQQLRPLKDEGDYSYAMTQIAGDRFVLVGDAARFVDPIFSTGVSIALNSARFASRDVIAALQTGNLARESFRDYETTVRRGTNNWYEFISVYYRLNVLFTYFINKEEYRLDVLKLLQGDVYDEESPAVLRKMKEMVRQVEGDTAHVWHRLLGELTSNAFRPSF
jgi:1H-pyrrole-2-carbonyl-[peptidyl-carrier protein] chlorinase